MNRRLFLQSTAGAALAAALAGCTGEADTEPLGDEPMAATGQGPLLERVGVQLYTLRSLMEQDVAKTLADVAAIGYQEVEFAGYFGHSPAEIRAMLDEHGLTAPAAHFPLDAFRDGLDATLETAKAIGHEYVVLAWLAEEDRRTLDQYRAYVDEYNRIGAACRDAGLQFAYHNHDFEFAPLDGQVPYDLLLEGTDPDLVKLELDFFWTVRAGQNPLAYFADYPGRFPLCHVKDMSRDDPAQQTPVGQGRIDFASYFAEAEQAGLRHYFVEQDNPASPLADVRTGYEYLTRA